MSPVVVASPPPARSLAERIRHLARLVRPLEGGDPVRSRLAFGLAEIDARLPGGGLAGGALHEAAPAAHGDWPAAFGFLACLAGRAAAAADGAVLIVVCRRAAADFGRPYGHGLAGLGLDPGRLTLVSAETDREALWAMEEAARAGACEAVVGCLAGGLDLTRSRRLHLVAEASGAFLLALRPPAAEEANAAATRWRIAAAAAARDRFGCFAAWRWRIGLERCRNGRPGEWVVEWDHAAHRFGLVGALADQQAASLARQGRGRRAG